MSSNADISLTTSNRANIKIGKPSSKGVNVSDPTMPKYVGARAVVTREEDGALITLSDYKGTTQAMVYDGSLPMYFGTTEEWDSQTTLVSEENAVYVYTDYKTIDGEQIAGFKVGDGLAYVVDLPFTDSASGGIQLKGTTTTALTDEATTNPIQIGGQSYTAVNQDAVFYGKKEFVFDGTKWHEFGDMSGLGSLATKDSATGNFTPQGSVTISTGSGTANYTPAGSVTVKAQKSGGTASTNYTPEGTVSVTPSTTTVNSITDVGSLPSLTMTVSNENLTIGFSQGTLPTKSSNQTVATGISSASFSGTQVSLSGSFSGTGAELKGSFSGTQGTVTVS